MPFNVTLNQALDQKIILKYPAPGAPRKHVVLDANDATAFPDPGKNQRFLVEAGTKIGRAHV